MNNQLNELLRWYESGEVFAYPTEAVFGLGCDPLNEQAVNKILFIKERPVEKGMILIASNFAQLSSFVEFDSLPKTSQTKILESWPGPITWLLPKSKNTPYWVSGDSDMVAVRVTAHPLVRKMCDHLASPMISTSANPASLDPAKSISQVRDYFGSDLHIFGGELGKQSSPSKIFHSLTMETIRA